MNSFLSSSMVLVLGGIVLLGLGLYFVLLRPPLLPEDLRYMGASLSEVQFLVPGLLLWVRRVMWVMGGYLLATGLLTIYVAFTTSVRVRKGQRVLWLSRAQPPSGGWPSSIS
jgi:hypothetical protein